MKAPVVLFVYNRPEHTRKTLESLQANDGAAESGLIVFADGPKENASPEELRRIEEVRAIVQEKNWCGNVRLIASEKNKGLAESVIDGVTQVVNEYGRIIVLEDDLVCSPQFLTFMNRALDVYENEERVVSITGYIYPVKEQLPETYFLRGADCWSWATWKRGWAVFEKDGAKLLQELEHQQWTHDFDFHGAYPYTQMLRDQVEGKNSSWAIRWYASAFLQNLLTLYPGRSLVQNIGIDGSGTHSGQSDKWDVQLNHVVPQIGQIPVEENSEARQAVIRFFRELRRVPLGKRIIDKLARLFAS